LPRLNDENSRAKVQNVRGDSSGVSGVRETQPAERDLADVPANLRVLGARQGVPGKVVGQLMGHTNAEVTINLYTQVLDASLRTGVDRIGGELFTIVHGSETGSELSC
jgi:hypothetical protein